MDGMCAMGSDSAVVQLYRRRRHALFAGQPPGEGQTFGALFTHAIIRSLILIALGIFLRSMDQQSHQFHL